MKPLPPKLSPPPTTTNNEEEEEEDYMSMALPTTTTQPLKKTETSIQRLQRLRREAEERGRVKSKAEKAAEEAAAREKVLQTSLIPASAENADQSTQNKGLAMMAKMGFKPGTALGKQGEGMIEPIGVEMKGDRGGIGLDTSLKRKFLFEADLQAKKIKTNELDYRERMMREKEEGRLERLVGGAMRVLEGLEEDEVDDEVEGGEGVRRKLLKSTNILYRGLIRNRELRERERRMRHDLQQSISRLSSYTDPSEDADDKLAYPNASSKLADSKALVLEEELEEEDEELEAFEALDVKERLGRVVAELRGRWWYCFWCKCRYEGEGMEGCPGVGEEDHD